MWSKLKHLLNLKIDHSLPELMNFTRLKNVTPNCAAHHHSSAFFNPLHLFITNFAITCAMSTVISSSNTSLLIFMRRKNKILVAEKKNLRFKWLWTCKQILYFKYTPFDELVNTLLLSLLIHTCSWECLQDGKVNCENILNIKFWRSIKKNIILGNVKFARM